MFDVLFLKQKKLEHILYVFEINIVFLKKSGCWHR